MNILEKIKQTFRQGDSLTRLIIINISVFVVLSLLEIMLRLFNTSGSFIWSFFAVPAQLKQLIYHFWTLFTYMFLHEFFWHLLFNMLSLYWFGKLFLIHFSEKQLVGLYLLGGLLGALFYIASFNIFPYYSDIKNNSYVLGASASVMAIILATAFKSPNMEMQLLLLGGVKLKYIALFAVLSSAFGITRGNDGGQLAHLGGALAGYLFFVSLRQGKDITTALTQVLNSISDLFRPRRLKVRPNKYRQNSPMSDADYNANKARKMAKIDEILDKIKTSGYDSLTTEEKKRLFEKSNEK